MTDATTILTQDIPTGDGPALFARYNFLRRERNSLETQMREVLERLKRECGEAYPYYHCRHCGYDWRGRLLGKRPRGCPRCHSATWDEEPILPTARRPDDLPNPSWKPRKHPVERPKGLLPVESPAPDPYDLPPPPKYVPPVSVRFGEEESGEPAGTTDDERRGGPEDAS